MFVGFLQNGLQVVVDIFKGIVCRGLQLSAHDGKAWRTVAAATGNYQRRRVHRFEPIAATKLRLTVHGTNGDKSARVFEIRAYNE